MTGAEISLTAIAVAALGILVKNSDVTWEFIVKGGNKKRK